jgi:hypothetical protein
VPFRRLDTGAGRGEAAAVNPIAPGRVLFGRRAVLVGGLAWATLAVAGCTEVRKFRHRRVRNRISAQVERAMQDPQGAGSNSMPFAKLDDANARWEILRAIYTALGNHFYYPNRVDEAMFQAVADRLDRTGGSDLKTLQGCLLIMDLLEQASPSAKDYAWFVTIHEAQAEGNIPKLDRSKIFN